LLAKAGSKRTETAEPPALRVEQRAEKRHTVEVRNTKPVEGTVSGY